MTMGDSKQQSHNNQVFNLAIDVMPDTGSKFYDDDGRLKRSGTIWTASAHIITAVIGSGVLSLAWAVAQLGWIAGPTVMFLFSFVTYYTSSLLADCYRVGDPDTGKRNYTYMDAVRANLGGMQVNGLSKPHCTIRYAMKKLLAHTEQKTASLLDSVSEHKLVLKSRSQSLRETLEKCGWEVIPPQSGVSMVARPAAYIGKSIKLEVGDDASSIYEVKLTDSTIREAMLKATGICINSGSWTGVSEFCRFTIALEDGEFQKALDGIVKFRDIVGISN